MAWKDTRLVEVFYHDRYLPAHTHKIKKGAYWFFIDDTHKYQQIFSGGRSSPHSKFKSVYINIRFKQYRKIGKILHLVLETLSAKQEDHDDSETIILCAVLGIYLKFCIRWTSDRKMPFKYVFLHIRDLLIRRVHCQCFNWLLHPSTMHQVDRSIEHCHGSLSSMKCWIWTDLQTLRGDIIMAEASKESRSSFQEFNPVFFFCCTPIYSWKWSLGFCNQFKSFSFACI